MSPKLNEPADESQKTRPRRALVLSGGGARGAYECGAIKALFERGLTFDYIFGTSIGAINATLLAQGDLDRMEELWLTVKPSDIFRFPSPMQMRGLFFGSRWGLLDNTPLEYLLYRELDVDRFKRSPMRCGFISTDLTSLETRLVMDEDIHSKKDLIDILMASSALPLVFPPRQFNGEGLWVDGAIVRNTPIQAAVNSGADEIYTILLNSEAARVCPTNFMEVLFRLAEIIQESSVTSGIRMVTQYNRLLDSDKRQAGGLSRVKLEVIQPTEAIQSAILDFRPDRSKQLLDLGYRDAMRKIETGVEKSAS